MITNDTTSSETIPAAAQGQAGDIVVLLAMAIVATAAGVAFAVEGGIPVGGAIGAGCALFAVFVAGHALRPGRKEAAPTRTVKRVRKVHASHPAAELEARAPVLDAPRVSAAEPQPERSDLPELSAAALGSLAPTAFEPPLLPPMPSPTLAVEPAPGSLSRLPGAPSAAPLPSAAPYTPPPIDPIQSYWSYAPGAPRFEGSPLAGLPSQRVPEAQVAAAPPLRTPLVPLAEAARVGPGPAVAETETDARSEAEQTYPRREDVEVIQSLIKKLADEVNAAEQREARETAVQHAMPPNAESAVPAAAADPGPAVGPLTDASIEASLTALRTTASTMRRGAAPHFDNEEAALAAAREQSRFATTAAPVPPPLPAAAPQGGGRIAALSEAIAAGRMDVLLEPIMGLEDNRARHYEVTVRLRAPSGEALGTEENRAELEGHRILPLIDAMKIVRTANVAARLGERGKDGSVFSDYAGESLADAGFLAEVRSAIAARPATAGQLVLSFSQSDVRGFEAPEWGALAGLRAVGFRFALSDVTDLDMDFEVMASCGFAFAKLDADVFLEGLTAPSGLVPASDVCRHLASHGLTLVVDRIDSDYKRVRIFGFGVLLGQGQLFGVPRPMKVDAVAGHRDAAA